MPFTSHNLCAPAGDLLSIHQRTPHSAPSAKLSRKAIPLSASIFTREVPKISAKFSPQVNNGPPVDNEINSRERSCHPALFGWNNPTGLIAPSVSPRHKPPFTPWSLLLKPASSGVVLIEYLTGVVHLNHYSKETSHAADLFRGEWIVVADTKNPVTRSIPILWLNQLTFSCNRGEFIIRSIVSRHQRAVIAEKKKTTS